MSLIPESVSLKRSKQENPIRIKSRCIAIIMSKDKEETKINAERTNKILTYKGSHMSLTRYLLNVNV